MKRTIYSQGLYRIIEVPDEFATLDDLMGDSYNPDVNTDICPIALASDKKKFIRQVEDDGVFGYVLEKWNPEVDIGWETVDSCWGFVGQYQEGAENYEHYIVNELKGQINE